MKGLIIVLFLITLVSCATQSTNEITNTNLIKKTDSKYHKR